MTTSLPQTCSHLDVHVPCDDVTATTVRPLSGHANLRGAAQLAIEIGGRAAWLAWQIDADEVLVNEAQWQLRGIGEDLARYASRLPAELHERMILTLQEAQASAQAQDLQAVARSARNIREVAERYRNTTMA